MVPTKEVTSREKVKQDDPLSVSSCMRSVCDSTAILDIPRIDNRVNDVMHMVEFADLFQFYHPVQRRAPKIVASAIR
jgi:hypothetical protein